MARQFFLDLARAGARVPLAVDVVAHDHDNAEQLLQTGAGRGAIMLEAAKTFSAPWVFSWMDLSADKKAILRMMGIPESSCESFVLRSVPESATASRIIEGISRLEDDPGLKIQCDAIRYAAERTDSPVMGSVVGSQTLITHLMGEDAISAFMNYGADPTYDGPEVRLMLWLHEYCHRLVMRSVECQIEAGAKAILVANPSAQTQFLPVSMPALFEELVVKPNQAVRGLLDSLEADLLLHDCGILCPEYVRALGRDVHPSVLSLGCSQKLWWAASCIPDDVVLYGNSPSKSYAHDPNCTVETVQEEIRETIREMAEVEHPYIAGTECDVLHVPGSEELIRARLDAIMTA